MSSPFPPPPPTPPAEDDQRDPAALDAAMNAAQDSYLVALEVAGLPAHGETP